jgi:hypothetical protein
VYFPYFRGKQYELLTIRENVQRMGTYITPIIEPVKQSHSALKRALEALIEQNVRFIVVGNPNCGDFAGGNSPLIDEEIRETLDDYGNWSLGCIVDESCAPDDIRANTASHTDVTIIHNGYERGSTLARILRNVPGISGHIFIENACSRLYRHHFPDGQRVLIRDGFIQRKNREYPPVEHFSDLHVTYRDEGMDGFGDFLIVGNEYSDTGGPAYAVAIHLTTINRAEDNDMFIKHYVSDRSATPTDPAGKFAEALNKLVADVNRRRTQIFRSDAVEKYLQLHSEGHYPGLGFVKKLSMQHHIELLFDFMQSE